VISFWLLQQDQTFYDGYRQINRTVFAGLYGNTSIDQEPMSAGRQMGGHFATIV
jgi:hypothetical protein